MIVVPANPNLVQVGMVRAGCLKTKFNSAYPTRLNGIIYQHEFQESIDNINRKISSNKSQIFCLVFVAVCIIGGLALVITGAVLSSSSTRSSFPFTILLYVGVGLIGFGPIFFSIALCIIRSRRTKKMRQAIAEESKKYSRRSPVACSWRLNIARILTPGYGRRYQIRYSYHVIIDIHHSGARSESARLHPAIPSQNELFPSLYPNHSVAFCSQCGAPRPDSTAKFCSSCGSPFNRY